MDVMLICFCEEQWGMYEQCTMKMDDFLLNYVIDEMSILIWNDFFA